VFTTPLVRQALPTGTGFGGSSLNIVRLQKLGFEIVSSSRRSAAHINNRTQPWSSLLIEVGKIFLLTLWLWCAIGFNSCFNGIDALANYSTQDV
jgi:hypothetical protein